MHKASTRLTHTSAMHGTSNAPFGDIGDKSKWEIYTKVAGGAKVSFPGHVSKPARKLITMLLTGACMHACSSPTCTACASARHSCVACVCDALQWTQRSGQSGTTFAHASGCGVWIGMPLRGDG